jgi:hypothetical protein
MYLAYDRDAGALGMLLKWLSLKKVLRSNLGSMAHEGSNREPLWIRKSSSTFS